MAKGIQVPVTQTGLSQSINQAVKQVGTVNLPVNVNPAAFKNLSQPLGRITGLATEFEKSIAASNARVIAFGASVGIINGFQNALSNLVRTGIEVQKTLADIAAISGTTGQELTKLSDGIFDVARNTSQSFQTAAQAALEFSRQGLGLEQTIARTNDALTLSRFTGLSAADAVDTLTAAFNSFQDSGVTTAQILNKLVAVDSAYAVSAADLAKAISRVGSVGIEAGVSLDELNAAVTAVQERTARGGAVIGNAFKTIFTNLRSENAIRALRDVGVESLNTTGELKPAIQVLRELSVVLQGLGEGERVQILETVASKYNINILSALTADLADQQSRFTGALQKSAQASTEAYDRQIQLNQTLAAAINTTQVSVTQLFNKLAEIGVTENLSRLLGFVNDLLAGINKLLDSESAGANIAKGLIKGISDVFFTVGLPIIAAIFVKLTRDIAQFGVESLKTILGINRQVKERQALEQAVVNTLIKDQQIMATILALSGDRAKQEQYLLSVYNQQIAALQKVQSIAQSVAPALQGAGLSATSGGVRRRAAGGYLPSQEASDVRRGVGGASPSSKVVSIPNFAFGGGKRGTMIANTSEYVVPNFANGGSAIFNPDMVKAYGLPAGAKKITAAGGFIPNFADYGFGKLKERAASASRAITLDAKWASGGVMLLPSPEEAAATNAKSQVIGVQPKDERKLPTGETVGSVKFDAFGLNDAKLKSRSGAKISQIESRIKDVIIGTGAGIVNDFKPLNRAAISKDEFVSIYDKKGGASGAAAAVAGSIFEAAVDYALNPQKATNDTQSTLDVPRLSPELINAFGITAPYGTTSGADYKISSNRARTFADQIIRNRLYRPFAQQGKASTGYIPNFAKQSALSDAIGREVAAGVSPSQVRVTQDGRLRNSQNPDGLAVINTRDEPNGKIPNFARYPAGTVINGENVSGRFATEEKVRQARQQALESAFTPDPSKEAQKRLEREKKLNEEENRLRRDKLEKEKKAVQGSTKNIGELESQTGKAVLAYSALTIALNTLQSSIKDTESGFGKLVTSAASLAQSVSTGVLLGGLVKDTFGSGTGRGAALARQAPAALGFGALALESITRTISNISEERGRPAVQAEQAAQTKVQALLTGAESPQDRQSIIDKQKKEADKRLAAAQEALRSASSNATYIDRLMASQSRLGQSYTEMGKGFLEGGFVGAAIRGAAYVPESIKTDQEIKARQELLAAEKESAATEQERKKIKLEIDALERQSKAQKDVELKNLQERIALERAFLPILQSFITGNNTILKQRAEQEARDIVQASNLGDLEKQQIEYNRKVESFDKRRIDLRRQSAQAVIEQITNDSALVTIGKENLATLQATLESGQDIADVNSLIKGLSLENAAAINKILLAQQKNRTEQLGIIQAEQTRVEIVDRIKLSEDARLSVLKAQNDLLSAQAEIARDIANQQRDRSLTRREGEAQIGLEAFRAQVAGQPFATPQQTKELRDRERSLKILQEENRISSTFRGKEEDAANKLRAAYKEIASNRSIFGEAETSALQASLSQATTLEDIRNVRQEIIDKSREGEKLDLKKIAIVNALLAKADEEEKRINAGIETAKQEREIALALLGITKERLDYEDKINNIRAESRTRAGLQVAIDDIRKESENFPEDFARNTTFAFRDGLKEALNAAISQTDDLGNALQNIARNFLQTIQQALLQRASNQIVGAIGGSFNFANGGIVKKYAGGGQVVGGSGYKDDVPAMLTSGEFVMRKSAVQKYGLENLEKMNDGGIFLPGVRGAGAISGYGDITRFAKQTTTSGATDIMRGGASSAFINLEDQSARLSRFGLLNEDTINQEIRSAQEQGLNIIKEREAYRTAQRKAFQKQLVSTVAAAVISYGVDKIANMASIKSNVIPGAQPGGATMTPYTVKGAYGGLMRRYADGGPTDDIPALLMGGEYVMSRQSTRKYGKQFFDAMNQGRAPRFAEGGMVGGANGTELGDKFDKLSTKLETTAASNISININVTNGGATETQTQGDTNRGGVDYKKMGDQIRQVVIQTINEEKRLGGSLRSR